MDSKDVDFFWMKLSSEIKEIKMDGLLSQQVEEQDIFSTEETWKCFSEGKSEEYEVPNMWERHGQLKSRFLQELRGRSIKVTWKKKAHFKIKKRRDNCYIHGELDINLKQVHEVHITSLNVLYRVGVTVTGWK